MPPYTSATRRLPKALEEAAPILSRRYLSVLCASDVAEVVDRASASRQWQGTWSYHCLPTSLHQGIIHGTLIALRSNIQRQPNHLPYSPMVRASFTSEASEDNKSPTEAAKELHAKLDQSIEAKSSPPNAWLWSLIESCKNEADINLLFQTLWNLRKFRLSALRINANFNSHLCQRVAEACGRIGAFEHGLMTLWKHNTYGLTPSIASAHYLLRHANERNDYKVMIKVMEVLRKNDLPLQPGTADLVFRICYNTDKWDLISIYSRKFIKAGVKLHRTTYDTWMEFAANRGDAPSLWNIEKLRSTSSKPHSLSSAFSCAKGFLLERKTEDAAAVIHVLNQSLPEMKRPSVENELQKLVSEWPLEVIKRTKGDKKALAKSLKKDIPVMVDSLMKMGMDVVVELDELNEGKLHS